MLCDIGLVCLALVCVPLASTAWGAVPTDEERAEAHRWSREHLGRARHVPTRAPGEDVGGILLLPQGGVRMLTGSLDLPPKLRSIFDEALRRVVGVARPQAVILLGSCAEGRSRASSDVGPMVIADTRDPSALAQDLYQVDSDIARGRWHEVPSLDPIVLTTGEWSHESQLPGQLAHYVKRHGVTVYGRTS